MLIWHVLSLAAGPADEVLASLTSAEGGCTAVPQRPSGVAIARRMARSRSVPPASLVPVNEDAFAAVALDATKQPLREAVCRAIDVALRNVAGWITIDSVLQTGDRPAETLDRLDSVDLLMEPGRAASFRAVASVVDMASNLTTGATTLLSAHNWYAAAGLIRQLIETEYLIRLFSIDFAEGARWERSTPDQIRASFRPHEMRAIGGFDHQEYWRHCEMGGHPTPQGRLLLEYRMARAEGPSAMWGDLAQHLQRLWLTLDELLVREHARYLAVRAEPRATVFKALEPWWDDDAVVAFALAWEPVGGGRGGPAAR